MKQIRGNIAGYGYSQIEYKDGLIQTVSRLGDERPGEPFISPGFIDTQINGFAGLHFSDPAIGRGDIERLLGALWETGTTTFLPTLISNTPDELKAAFARLEKFRSEMPDFARSAPFYHLEGPYLSSGPSAGAHKSEFMKDPDWDEFQEIQAAANGRIRIVTIAPERNGTGSFIQQAVKAGIRVALSHTDGRPEDVRRAADNGASMNTHLGNGCPQVFDRHVSPFWTQLEDDRLKAGLICDGFHLTREMVRIILRVKGIRNCLLVSDAVFVAGLAPGPYQLGGKPIELLDTGQVVTADRKSMAGSTLNMADAVSNFLEMTGLPLATALLPATRVPADYLSDESICSEIREGGPANLIVFAFRDNRISVEQTILDGETVHS